MAIVDLEYHPFAYVTIGELAEYWRLPRRHVIQQIDAGDVQAIQFGPGLYRIRTITAIAFEQRALGARSWRPLTVASLKPSLPRIQPAVAGAHAESDGDGGCQDGQSSCGEA